MINNSKELFKKYGDDFYQEYEVKFIKIGLDFFGDESKKNRIGLNGEETGIFIETWISPSQSEQKLLHFKITEKGFKDFNAFRNYLGKKYSDLLEFRLDDEILTETEFEQKIHLKMRQLFERFS